MKTLRAIGEVVQWAWWLTGYETESDLREYAEATKANMDYLGDSEGWKFSDPHTVTLYPGDPHVPDVPDHIKGPDVRVLITEVKIVGYKHKIKKALPGFCHDLEPDDLAKLRMITRRKYREEFPQYPELTDAQCDTLINDLGPDVAVDTLKALKPSDLI